MAIYIRKVVMLGDPAVGKTSLVHKYVNDMFDDSYLSTIGAKPVKKVIERGEDVIILIIWDIAGHNYNLHPAYYLGAKGALVVCDMTRLSTVDTIQSWILIRSYLKGILLVMCRGPRVSATVLQE